MRSRISAFVKQGFTLVEMLIALLLGTVIAGAVVTVLVVFVFNFEQTDDITAARQRGEMVLSILEGPILHAGLGMPDTSPDFYNSFKVTEMYAVDDLLETSEDVLKSPVQVEDSSTDLYVCYAMPSHNVNSESSDISNSEFTITMENSVDSDNNINDPPDVDFKSWVTFPTGGIPLHVKGKNVNELTLISAEETDSRISQYDELHYIRAMYAWVEDGSFKTKELPSGSGQPRVDGIEDIFFDYDSGNGLLTVYVLARGNQKNSDFAKDNVQGWPQEISNSQYRLVVTRGSWRIRN